MNIRLSVAASMLTAAVALSAAGAAHAQVTGYITIDNNAASTSPVNGITTVGNSVIISGIEGYQTLARFPDITLADGQYIELTGTYQALSRLGTGTAAGLTRLQDQVRVGLFRAPVADGTTVQAQNLTGYIIEHRNEMREIRTPIAAPANGQAPFVSQRSSLINADLPITATNTSSGSYSTAAPSSTSSGGNPDAATETTEADLVHGRDVTFDITYRIARVGNLLNITGSIAGGAPSSISPPAPTVPPAPPAPGVSDGAFLETFSALNYDPLINVDGGTDNFDFRFNRLGFLMGGNIDLDLGPAGDFNANGTVDPADMDLFADHFGVDAGADVDLDGDTDGADFLLLQQGLGRSDGTIVLSNVNVTSGTSATAAAGAAPEPAAAVLFGLASLGLAGSRRRRLTSAQ